MMYWSITRLFDSFSEPGRSLLKHYDGMRPDFKGTGFESSSAEMLEKGYTFDFISDRQILGTAISWKRYYLKGNIIKLSCYLIASTFLASFTKIMDMAKAGATVVVYKNLPSTVPGYGKLEERENAFKKMLAS